MQKHSYIFQEGSAFVSVCVCVSGKILTNTSSKVAKLSTDVIVNEKQSA